MMDRVNEATILFKCSCSAHLCSLSVHKGSVFQFGWTLDPSNKFSDLKDVSF